jgi:hypothetical protein
MAEGTAWQIIHECEPLGPIRCKLFGITKLRQKISSNGLLNGFLRLVNE